MKKGNGSCCSICQTKIDKTACDVGFATVNITPMFSTKRRKYLLCEFCTIFLEEQIKGRRESKSHETLIPVQGMQNWTVEGKKLCEGLKRRE